MLLSPGKLVGFFLNKKNMYGPLLCICPSRFGSVALQIQKGDFTRAFS